MNCNGEMLMNLYGLMITKDDHEVIDEWCHDQLDLDDAVVCLDGSNTDETRRIVVKFSSRFVYLHEKQYSIPFKTDHGLRRVVHQEICRRFGLDNWIMCCHADEFCYHDPRKIAVKASQESYDLVAWFSVHFLPHPDELGDFKQHQREPVYNRYRHYHWSYRSSGLPWLEHRLYQNGPAVFWDEITHGSMAPHHLNHPAPFHPILRHYKVFTTDLNCYQLNGDSTLYRQHWTALKHRTGLPIHLTRAEDFFVRSFPPYERCDRFEGVFNHSWNMREHCGIERGPCKYE